ncbi:MAG TPA: urease accessory protein UreJ [Rhodospirillaceae bacterium]|nr:urease accessory protein UreJ [Rhodospirillaceae bacterium]HAA91403.1 urease accessory protein UreJ [Rhodospirillaceae bacterium]HAT34689.1 urease accessory protein UreJ [Rhodospirillaceae bacterium]|tara:strand:- start:92 stop:736 length:645 start_codon:yes stop_codon:yes gene_type:complete
MFHLKCVFRVAGIFLSLFLIAVLVAAPAEAHHPMGYKLPQTMMQGLLSGFGHPVIGLDHLAFVIAMGLIAAAVPRGLTALGAFIGGGLLGCVIHLFAFDLPFAEPIIALSVILAGLVLVLRQAISTVLFAVFIGVAGVFHGYAYGESIIGAEATVLGAYLIGFSLVQFAIGWVAYTVVNALRAAPVAWIENGVRIAGGVIGVFGLYALSNQFIA